MKLVKPSSEYKESFLDMCRDFDSDINGLRPLGTSIEEGDWEEFVKNCRKHEKGLDLPEGWVPGSSFWLMDSTNCIAGVVSIRHRLSPDLIQRGGHVGYGIRPSCRRQGYGTKALELALNECHKMGILDVLVTCSKDNIASEKIIRANGGIQDSNTFVDGKEVQRFWIFLKK